MRQIKKTGIKIFNTAKLSLHELTALDGNDQSFDSNLSITTQNIKLLTLNIHV